MNLCSSRRVLLMMGYDYEKNNENAKLCIEVKALKLMVAKEKAKKKSAERPKKLQEENWLS